ncbi:hypothetical protein Ae406Ps2_6417c [Pseudonocardia sp. Ae406_Ps2]|nr:hypothetical protein Ae406Ps2_6417c [Pseudonocardia sp. Ae406_Ps2]
MRPWTRSPTATSTTRGPTPTSPHGSTRGSTPTSTMILAAASTSSTHPPRNRAGSRVGSRGLTSNSRGRQDHRRGPESTPTMIMKPPRLHGP